jgi:hypothetical protein
LTQGSKTAASRVAFHHLLHARASDSQLSPKRHVTQLRLLLIHTSTP